MDKITRIHLAKIPYEISISAQEKLKKYFDEIRDELDDNLADEIMTDIEVRVTEILSDRNVKRDDIITNEDIDAIEDQLGSPEQFTDGEGKSNKKTVSLKESKRLLRDKENAYIGGVASGLGAYFGIDPIFIRLIFIALVFVSGLGIVLYILLWVLVPPAMSSSDKLQMTGQPVTAASLQEYRSSVQRKLGNGPAAIRKVIVRVFQIVITTFSGLAGLFILAILGIISSFTFVYPFRSLFVNYGLDYVGLALLWIIGISFIGLAVILVIRIWGRRTSHLKLSAVSFLTALIIALAGTGAVGILIYNHFSNEYGNGKTTTALLVNNTNPNTTPTKLQVNSDSNLSVTYVITNQPIHASYSAYPGLKRPSLSITNNNGTIAVNSNDLSQAAPSCLGNLCRHIYLPIHVTLYGPKLSNITDSNGASLWINNANFGSSVSIKATNWSTIDLENNYATTMDLTAASNSMIDAGDSSAQQTNVTVDLSSMVIAPDTVNLNATIPSSCNQNGIQVLNLNEYSGVIKLNGQVQTTDDLNQSSCIQNGWPTPPSVVRQPDQNGQLRVHKHIRY